MILHFDSHLNLENTDPWTPPQTNDIKIPRGGVQARVFLQSNPNVFTIQPQLRTTVLSATKVIENDLGAQMEQ